jgi:ABC-2 type transport system ATP-binding protein
MAEKAVRVELEGLVKRYRDVQALSGLSLVVRAGEVVGLIGPDGAGKTTAMRIACGLVVPDSGRARVLGWDSVAESHRVKEHLGYMPQRFSLYPDLSVAENLRFFADLFAVPGPERRAREARLMDFSGLGPFRARRAGALSGGMKQKLALCCTLIHTPDVLVLDEPTTGVDVVSRAEFWKILRGLAADGLALLVSTPYMDEAGRFDRVLLMYGGRSIAAGTPGEMAGLFRRNLLEVVGPEVDRARRALAASCPGGVVIHRFGDRLHVAYDTAEQEAAVRSALSGVRVEVGRASPTIEDAFVAIVGAARAEAA